MSPTDELKNTIIAELQLGDVPQPQQDALVEGVAQNIFDALMIATLESLPDDAAREKLTQMMEAGDLTTLKAFARAQIDGFDNLMASVVRDEIEAHKT